MRASERVASAVENTPDIDFVNVDWALACALPILRAILSNMPWYRKVLLTVKFLIGGIEEYLQDKGWEV